MTYGEHPKVSERIEEHEREIAAARASTAVMSTADRIATSTPGMEPGTVTLSYAGVGATIDWAVQDVRAAVLLTHKRLLDFGFHLSPNDWESSANGMRRTFRTRAHLDHRIVVGFSLADDATCAMVKVGEKTVDVLELQCGGIKVEA